MTEPDPLDKQTARYKDSPSGRCRDKGDSHNENRENHNHRTRPDSGSLSFLPIALAAFDCSGNDLVNLLE